MQAVAGEAAALDRVVEALLTPADRVRRALLGAFAPWLRPVFARRDLRVGLMGAAGVSFALGLVAAAPLWCLLWGPLLVGVPHLLADARYLVARQGLHRRPGFWAAVALPAALTWSFPRAPLGLVAVVGAAAIARTSLARRAAVAVPAALLVAAALRAEGRVSLAFAHAHNVVALALWWAWARGRGRWRALVPACVAAGACAVAFGALDDVALRPWALRAPAAGFDLGVAAGELSPVDPSRHPLAAARWALAFAFLQSVHYLAWLRLLPDEDRARAGVRGFVGSYRALVADVGRPLVALAALVAAALVVGGMASGVAARGAYLRLAFGHGYLELAVVALLALEGTWRRADGGAVA